MGTVLPTSLLCPPLPGKLKVTGLTRSEGTFSGREPALLPPTLIPYTEPLWERGEWTACLRSPGMMLAEISLQGRVCARWGQVYTQ